MTTTSGRKVTAARTASAAVVAVPTSSKPSRADRDRGKALADDAVVVGHDHPQGHDVAWSANGPDGVVCAAPIGSVTRTCPPVRS